MEINKSSVSESRVRGNKRPRSPSKDEGRPVKRERRNSQGKIRPSPSTAKTQKGSFKVPSGHSEAAAGSAPGDTWQLRSQLQCEINQQLARRQLQSEAAVLDSTGQSTTKPTSKRLEDIYDKGALIGSGVYGNVYAGIRKKDGLPVAIKEVRKDDGEEVDIPALGGKIPKEVALLMQLSIPPTCPYVIQLIEWFDGPESHFIVMERPEPCLDLNRYSIDCGGYVSEELAQLVLLQLLLAVFHCEERGVRHGDISAQNLLIETDSLLVKLIDFGCGSFHEGSSDLGAALHQPLDFDAMYTVLRISAMLFHLVCGMLPVRSRETGSLQFPRAVSEEFKNFMNWCISRDRTKRPTLEQIAAHPWLQKGWKS
ncbi:serine/threonine-protein kinase pim-3-like isoform X2 [Brienomyrus brachyistius]|uniref:serine/threonine-protein kinase pim-3-like isoform X2 n=1 Tax=Brienomyrus brachyistius TaxID=42636 RepID=UPI0020B40579|nr:serine/threonine-protein kinase pim-3-like isoform X2 [Brienomyrus brachyistius]